MQFALHKLIFKAIGATDVSASVVLITQLRYVCDSKGVSKVSLELKAWLKMTNRIRLE